MVNFDHNTAEQTCVCTSDKLACAMYINKELGGYRFFVISMEKGNTPKELSGKYSSMTEAKKAVEKYLRNKPKSSTVRRNENAELRRKKKHGAKSDAEGS